FESNLFDNLDNKTLTTSFRHVWIYVGGSSLSFKDMTLWGFWVNNESLTNSQQLNIELENCTFKHTVLLGYIKLIRIINCKFDITSGSSIVFRTAVDTLYLVGCVFASGYSGFYLAGGTNIKHYYPRDIHTDTARASLWKEAAPIRTDLSSKY